MGSADRGVSRRAFLGGAAGVALAVAGVAGAEEAGGPIIDSHIHVWDLQALSLPWLKGAGEILRRNYTPADYARAIAGTGIGQAIYVEVGADPKQRKEEAKSAVGLCTTDKIIRSAIVAAGPGQAGFADYIRPLARERCILGIREFYRPGSDQDQRFLADLKLLGELQLHYEFLLGAAELEAAARIAAACSKTQFVLDHCANPPVEAFSRADSAAKKLWREGIARVAEQENVMCKISALAECSRKANPAVDDLSLVLNHCLDAFGEERVMFGSNWPVCVPFTGIGEWVKTLRLATQPRGDGFLRKLFHDNALRVITKRGR